MMLDWFGPGELPGNTGPYPKPQTDVSTYQKVWVAARNLESECTEARSPGWSVLGEKALDCQSLNCIERPLTLCGRLGDRSAMGIFVWATDSRINGKVKSVPVFTSLPGLNISEVASPGSVETS